MKNQKQTIRKIVSYLNNPDEDGGFWLPNIQRPFVWKEGQICRLFDSILREYPISTLLVWKTTSNIRHRKFIDNWKADTRLSDFFVPENGRKKYLVLDGQQRLQSLFIGLVGSFESRELHIDILSGETDAPDDIKYKFEFRDTSASSFPWVNFKNLIFMPKNNRQLTQYLEELAGQAFGEIEKNKVADHLELISKTFKMDEVITYQELDSIDSPELYKEDDVVEIFIRANSGGTRLGKSDLLFTLLSSSWDFADEAMENLLIELNKYDFKFSRDFILKTCLTVLRHGAQYEVEKFRQPGVRDKIESRWEEISEAIKDVLDFVRGKTYIHSAKALPSYLVLIPLIYLRFNYLEAWRNAKQLDVYLLRSSLAGAFGGTPDRLINALTAKIDETGNLNIDDAFAIIRSQGRSLELTGDRLLSMGYGSDQIHILFNIWYRTFNYAPAFKDNLPQVDHIFPQSLLKKEKLIDPDTNRKTLKYKDQARDQLANCMLLSRAENGAGGKSDIPPEEWFSNKSDDYLTMHIIPKNKELWKLERYEDFIKARKQLILDAFETLLIGAMPGVIENAAKDKGVVLDSGTSAVELMRESVVLESEINSDEKVQGIKKEAYDLAEVSDKEQISENQRLLAVKHEQNLLPDKGVLVLKSIKIYKTFQRVDQSSFKISDFVKIKELEDRFKRASLREDKEVIFKELKNLPCLQKAFDETKCLGSFIKINGKNKDYKLSAVVRPVTAYADCNELHKRSQKQLRYYE